MTHTLRTKTTIEHPQIEQSRYVNRMSTIGSIPTFTYTYDQITIIAQNIGKTFRSRARTSAIQNPTIQIAFREYYIKSTPPWR